MEIEMVRYESYITRYFFNKYRRFDNNAIDLNREKCTDERCKVCICAEIVQTGFASNTIFFF